MHRWIFILILHHEKKALYILMEARDAIVKIVKALLEIAEPTSRQTLIDFLVGKETRDIEEKHLDELETYGIGDEHDDDYWSTIIDAAYENDFLKSKNVKNILLVPTPAGKKFAKKPTSFIIEEDDEIKDNMSGDSDIAELVEMAKSEKISTTHAASPRTKQQIKLIQTIDRKIALDDFAESESLSIDEVLDDLESLIKQGRKMDITYFTDEVMGPDCVEELTIYFQSNKSDDLESAVKEFAGVYNEEEIRLARVVYRIQQMK